MKLFKFLWSTHKWTGIVLAVVFLNIAVSGFFLLNKKDYDWIQPPTQSGAAGEVSAFISPQRLFEIVFAQEHPDFKTLADVDRVDFRPAKRVHKVRSVHNYAEIQVDAVTGDVLSTAIRRSDWFERLHDGSLYGAWVHDWLMPLVAVSLVFMVCSGLYIWYFPVWKKKRRQRAQNRS